MMMLIEASSGMRNLLALELGGAGLWEVSVRRALMATCSKGRWGQHAAEVGNHNTYIT